MFLLENAVRSNEGFEVNETFILYPKLAAFANEEIGLNDHDISFLTLRCGAGISKIILFYFLCIKFWFYFPGVTLWSRYWKNLLKSLSMHLIWFYFPVLRCGAGNGKITVVYFLCIKFDFTFLYYAVVQVLEKSPSLTFYTWTLHLILVSCITLWCRYWKNHLHLLSTHEHCIWF